MDINLEIRVGAVDLLRRNLPIDTGNLRHNATQMVKTIDGFEMYIDGTKADYFEYLEENPESKYYRDLEEVIVPRIVAYLSRRLNSNYRNPLYLEQRLDINEGRFWLREERMKASLARSGIIVED